MKHKPTKIRKIYLISSLLILILGFFLTLILANREAGEYEETQRNAMERMERAEAYIKERIIEKGIEIEEIDLNKTGLIGPEFTELTSTMGEIGAKRSTLNPEFAALMIRYFKEAGLKEGDTIAIGASGSFPGLLIATLVASSEMKLDARVIASLGASTYGATRVEYNIYHILEDLKESKEADFSLVGVSMGGEGDKGGGAMEGFLYDGSKELSYNLSKEEADKTGAVFIYEDTLSESIKRRLDLYGENIKLFINIGGASTNLGTGSYSLDFPPGLVMGIDKIPKGKDRGLIFEYMDKGIPVINLLSIKKICQMNSIVFDPYPLPTSSSFSYTSINYNKAIIIVTLLSAFSILLVGVISSKKAEKKKRKSYIEYLL